MKTILCYGDSLTWGHDVVRQTRHAFEDRWPNIVQAELGSQVHVISEGLGGRTTAFDDYLLAADLNGARSLPVVLSSHSPLDLVVVMLGTNDMKPWVNGAALGSARGMKRLTEIIRTHPYPLGGPVPKVLLVSPPHIMSIDRPDVAQMLAGGAAFSRELAALYTQVANELGCGFFDAATVATPSPVDGVHLDAENTRAIGKALAPVIKTILGL